MVFLSEKDKKSVKNIALGYCKTIADMYLNSIKKLSTKLSMR
jgi:CRISPR/Cas system-associated exonuclease Cas4 (RecB family)